MTIRDDARKTNLRGIAFALLGLLVFASNNVVIKWLIVRYPVAEVLAARSAVSLLWLAPLIRVADLERVRRVRFGLHLARAAISACEIACFFTAISMLPLADVTVFYLATPIYVTALSPVLLAEKVGWRRWSAVLVGFAGVVVALQPGRATVSPPALVALLGGVLFALVVITTRGLRATPNRMLIALQLGAMLIVALLMAERRWTVPASGDAALMVFSGTLSVLGYAAFNHSLRIAPASVVSPFQYTSIVWASLFGFLVFGDRPSLALAAGALIIIAAGMFILWRERSVRRGEPEP